MFTAMLINPVYFLREAGISFRRNWVMSIGAIITIFLSLLLIGTSMMAGEVVNSLVKSVESKVSIQVYIKDDAATQDIEVLQRKLVTDPLVKSVNFTSKEQALENFKKTMSQSPEIVENLEGNPLPASIDIELKDARDVETVAQTIRKSETFTKIADHPENPEKSLKYGKKVVKKLFAFTRIIRLVGLIFVIMLGVVSLIFINNTIRLAIYARRQEIAIMRLVGASNWFIRAPFILEGIFQALIGAALAIGGLLTMQFALLPKLQSSISFMHFNVLTSTVISISGMLILLGCAIGAFGSWLAMRKYLKI